MAIGGENAAKVILTVGVRIQILKHNHVPFINGRKINAYRTKQAAMKEAKPGIRVYNSQDG